MSESSPIQGSSPIPESNPIQGSSPIPEFSPIFGIEQREALDLVSSTDFNESVFKSCSVIPASADCVKYDPVTMSLNYPDLVQIPLSVKCSHQMPKGNGLPVLQPGAGIYTSALTFNTRSKLDVLVEKIHQVLHILQMPNYYDSYRFKWSIVTYFTSGFARFSVRIWSHNSDNSDNYAVEVMRERGDRILVIRTFELLSDVITNIIAIEDLVFSPDMFDWAPLKLPDEILATLPKPSKEAIQSGIDSMVSMVTTPYDDVCINGCASIAKLASANISTKNNLGASRAIIEALLRVVFGSYSLDTQTLAAMSLSVLTDSTSFVPESVSKEYFTLLEKMTDKDTLAERFRVKSHEVHYLAYYNAQTIVNIRALLG
jgi:hypothetical protein